MSQKWIKGWFRQAAISPSNTRGKAGQTVSAGRPGKMSKAEKAFKYVVPPAELFAAFNLQPARGRTAEEKEAHRVATLQDEKEEQRKASLRIIAKM